ncbi:hypothetical protein [Actinoplanes palleronii]|uniref:Lipoprotein n=1 Tax=Actinoplanes palleronii TaxID=113570 RepID=A0ABQ4BTE3_9ACTN|nr:hypothetical protein [Actinoplanes palleronii]GIE73942.1 hypothetical protein Apa02nite_100500 [Actinoplanes palleronii]
MRTLAPAILILLLGACTASKPAPATTPPRGDCETGVSRAALPEWARAGFTGDGAGTPHRLGDRGDLMAVLFNYPPVADPDRGTKILWVSRLPVDSPRPLVIDAVRDDGQVARQELTGGAGPSSVQLPAPGCWALTLSWSGHTDAMRLRFT